MVSAGIHYGREHIYVTHRATGKQWVSKSPVEDNSPTVSSTVGLIQLGATNFNPDRDMDSCDTRFWQQVRPAARNDFDSLCFIGD